MALVHFKFFLKCSGQNVFLVLNQSAAVPFFLLKKVIYSIDAEKNSCWVYYLFSQAVRALEEGTDKWQLTWFHQ